MIYVMILTGAGRLLRGGGQTSAMKGFLLDRRQEVRRARRRRVPLENLSARDCGGKRLAPGRRVAVS